MEYWHKESPQPKKFKTQASAGKVMLTAFWDVNGVIIADFMERGTTINSERYIEFLNMLEKRLKRVWNENHAILQHDNATPRTSARTRETIKRLGFSLLPHPPYSPDLAPSDSYLFPKLKEHLRSQHFGSDEEVKSAVRKYFREQNSEFYKNGFQKLVYRWCKCIEVEGDYVEK
jgi:histone-lysine N-methyltransferase SETMAR